MPTKTPTKYNPTYRWGTLIGTMPTALRVAARKGDKQLNNRPLDIVHNHEARRPVIKYQGYCRTAPGYHLFACVQTSDPPRRKVNLIEFQAGVFTSDSKAGQGGCSMRHCPGSAVQMNEVGKQAYCEKCVQRVTGNVPCQWTAIEACLRHDCPICRDFA